MAGGENKAEAIAAAMKGVISTHWLPIRIQQRRFYVVNLHDLITGNDGERIEEQTERKAEDNLMARLFTPSESKYYLWRWMQVPEVFGL